MGCPLRFLPSLLVGQFSTRILAIPSWIPTRASTTSVAGDPAEPSPTEPPSTAFDTTTTSTPTAPNSTPHHHTRDTTTRNAPRDTTESDRRGHHRDTPPLGIELHRVTMAATPLIAKDVPVTITVKDPRDTTLLEEIDADRSRW